MSCIGMLYCKGTFTLAVLLLLYPCIHAKMLYTKKKKKLATKSCFPFHLPGLSFDQDGTTMQRQQTCCSLYMHEILCYEQLLLATFLEVTTLPPPKNCFHSNYVVP